MILTIKFKFITNNNYVRTPFFFSIILKGYIFKPFLLFYSFLNNFMNLYSNSALLKPAIFITESQANLTNITT